MLKENDFRVLNYLQSKKDYVSMTAISQVLEISKREVRKSVERIKKFQEDTIIISNNNGYKIARTDEEIKNANNIQLKRFKTLVEIIVANDPTGSSTKLHSIVAEVVNNHRHTAEGQIDIEGKTTTYHQ